MLKIIFYGLILLAAIIFFGFVFFGGSTETILEDESVEEIEIVENKDNSKNGEGMQQTAHIVEMSSSGFFPSTLTINKGDAVVFKVIDNSNRWPASDIHPTHRSYPGSDIKKCSTSERDKIFDSCRGLSEGENYTFTFNELGEWNYHDHLSASARGKIIVK